MHCRPFRETTSISVPDVCQRGIHSEIEYIILNKGLPAAVGPKTTLSLVDRVFSAVGFRTTLSKAAYMLN